MARLWQYYSMKITGTKLARWQKNILDKSISDEVDFIYNKYNFDKSLFDLITLRCSTSCRFAKYNKGIGLVRVDLKDTTVRLYNKKTLGVYNTNIKSVGSKISWTCQLIHELTHFVQDLEERCFSEVETTQNEIEYLRSINVNTNIKN